MIEKINQDHHEFAIDSHSPSKPSDSTVSELYSLAGSPIKMSQVDDHVVKFDGQQFKALFDECFTRAISSPAVGNLLQNIVGAELGSVREEVSELSSNLGYLNSKIVQCENELEALKLVKTRVIGAENSILRLSREIIDVNTAIVQGDFEAKFAELNNKIVNMELNLREEFRAQQQLVNDENVALPSVNVENNPVIVALSGKVASLESNRNLKFLLFDGIPEEQNEDLPAKIVRELHGVMIPQVKLVEIESARRVGNARDLTRPRTIIVEFVYSSIAMRVYQGRMQLAKAGKPIFISEYLTKEAAYLFYLARQNRGEGKPLAKTWTWRGQIYVAKARNARGTLVRNQKELEYFISLPFVPVPQAAPVGAVPGPANNNGEAMAH